MSPSFQQVFDVLSSCDFHSLNLNNFRRPSGDRSFRCFFHGGRSSGSIGSCVLFRCRLGRVVTYCYTDPRLRYRGRPLPPLHGSVYGVSCWTWFLRRSWWLHLRGPGSVWVWDSGPLGLPVLPSLSVPLVLSLTPDHLRRPPSTPCWFRSVPCLPCLPVPPLAARRLSRQQPGLVSTQSHEVLSDSWS